MTEAEWRVCADPASMLADGAGTGEELATAHLGAAEVARDVWLGGGSGAR